MGSHFTLVEQAERTLGSRGIEWPPVVSGFVGC
jgi:hypothetical protein